LEVRGRIVLPENHLHSLTDQIACNAVCALQLTFVLEFDLSSNRGQSRVNVGNSRNDLILPGEDRSPLCIADHIFKARDRQALTHAGSFVDSLVTARLEGDRLNDLPDKLRYQDSPAGVAARPRLLLRYCHTMIQIRRVVSLDLGSNSILE